MLPLPVWELEEEVFSPPELAQGIELRLYPEPQLPQRPYWRSFLFSALLHLTCILSLPYLMDLLPETEAEAWQRYLAMRPLEVRVPDRLFFTPTPEIKPPKPAQAKPKPTPAELSRPKLIEAASGLAAPRLTTPRQFTPPPGVRRTQEDLTLIQSHLPPELPLTVQVKLPQLALLSAPVLPRPAPRRFVEPGKSASPAVAPRLDAPPMLAPPSEANPELKVPEMIAGPDSAALRLPRPTAPVKKFQAPAPPPSGRGASLSPSLGEPINILAFSTNPAPLTDRITIPLGNQIGRLPELPGPPAADAKAPLQGAVGNGVGLGTGGSEAGGRNAELEEFAKAMAALPAQYAVPIRIEHPVNGVFDVVVTQSSGEQAFPESAGLLSGKPVYTVYLQVGAPKAWILQYCIPKQAEGPVTVAPGVVNIGSPSPVKAPYPLVTVLPPVTMLPRTGYIIVHGLIDTQGRIREAEVVRAPKPAMKEPILADLNRWQFRPAVRNGAPVAVEILIAIPPQEI